MEYRIERTDTANEQLRDIILYRADVTGDTSSALELLDLMEAEIRQLADFPEMGSGAALYRAAKAWLSCTDH